MDSKPELDEIQGSDEILVDFRLISAGLLFMGLITTFLAYLNFVWIYYVL